MRRRVCGDGAVSATASVTTSSDNEINKKLYRRRERPAANIDMTDIATKRSEVSPSGEHNESSAELTRPLTNRRRTFGELQMDRVGAATAAEDCDKVKATQGSVVKEKVRYFSNFYRQAEPGEVFVGGRTKDKEDYTESTRYSRHYSVPFKPPLTLSFVTEPYTTNAMQERGFSMTDPSLASVWYQLVHGSVTSLPPSLANRTADDVALSSLCRRS